MPKLETDAAALNAAEFRSLKLRPRSSAGFAPQAVQVARYLRLDRWSHEAFMQDELLGNNQPEASFDFVTLEDIGNVTYGIQKCPSNRPGTHARPYLRVANVRRGGLDLDEIKYINVPDHEMKRLRLEPGDILFVEGNGTKSELGRAAIWNGEIADCVHQTTSSKRGQTKPKPTLNF